MQEFRRIVSILVLAFGFSASPTWAAISLVQKCPASGIVGGNNPGTQVSCTFSSNNTGGNFVFVFGYVMGSSNNPTLSVADTAGNSYVSVDSDGSSTAAGKLWVAYNISGSANTITVTSTQSAEHLYVGGGEYSGVATSAALDKYTHAYIDNQTDWDSGAAATTTQANELLTGAALGGNGSCSASAGYADPPGNTLPYTLRGATTYGAASPAWEDRVVSSTGAYHATFTYSSSCYGWAFVATFKAAGAGTPAQIRGNAAVRGTTAIR